MCWYKNNVIVNVHDANRQIDGGNMKSLMKKTNVDIRNKINKIKKIPKDKCFIIINTIIFCIMAVLHAVEAGHYVDFIPINGTFQDYNPVRRFLSEQIPYKDFQDYLGLGHLYMGAIFTSIFGGKYDSSLIAFRLIAFVSTSMIICLILFVVIRKLSTAMSLTNILLAIFLIKPSFLNTIVGDTKIEDAFSYAMSTGNSARMLRGMILPISAMILVTFFMQIFEKNKKECNKFALSCIIGGIAGACFPWSNDYGISCWLCLMIMVLVVVIARTRSLLTAIKCLLLAVTSSIISIFLVVNILTIGHFTEWVAATFGTGGFQTWYYNSEKSYYIADVDFSYIMMIQAFLCIFYIVKIFKNNSDYKWLLKYGVLAYVNMVAFCATNEYKMLSGGSSSEVAMIVLYSTVFAEIISTLKGYIHKSPKFVSIISTIVCCAWIVSSSVNEFKFWALTDKEGIYVEQMGGYMKKLGTDLISTKEFLGDKTCFATYASAQELMADKFQPSGTDYIIHVLGDKQREEYLESFESDEFDYAVTINENYSDWEFWIQRANWFFYEKLFENWHPVYANSYEIYWERNNSTQNDTVYFQDDISASIIDIDENSKKIVVQTNQFISGMASVYVDYTVNKQQNNSSKFLFTSMVNVENTGEKICLYDIFETNNLRAGGKEYIPIPIVNGYGEVTLTAKPEKSVDLQINNVHCSKIYRVQYQYLQIDGTIRFGDKIGLHIVNSKRTEKILPNLTYVYIGENKYVIDSYTNGYIVIQNAYDIDEEFIKYNNMLKVQ